MLGIRTRLQQWKEGLIRDALVHEGNWGLLDRVGIPGFGTYLLRTFYPVRELSRPRWGHGSAELSSLAPLFSAQHKAFSRILSEFAPLASKIQQWPEVFDPATPTMPTRKNEFFAPLDALALAGLLSRGPKRYIEIGSGNSTCVAHWVRQSQDRNFTITSIDPNPRKEIDLLCDHVVRSPLEQTDPSVFRELEPGDVLFYDGSHYTFPGNDVVVFFLEVLPSIPAGVSIHIHDIYLPADYPADIQKHLWSEQYMLAAYLMNSNVEILFPSAYISAREEFAESLATLPEGGTHPSSFWFRKR